MAYKDLGGGRDPMKDASWVILFLIILGVVWFAQGGLSKLPSTNLFPEPTGSYNPNSQSIGSQNAGQNSESTEQKSLSESRYKGKVSLRSYGAMETDSKREYLEIRTGYNVEPITISGWKLENRNISIVIGNGSPLAYLAQVNFQEPIILQPNSRVIVITGQSPIGTSFRLNTCTGYFNQFHDFTPSLPEECPYIYEKDLPKNYPDACFDFVKNLTRCRMPMTGVPMGAGNDCANFIAEKANYSGCVNLHKKEEDFNKKEWRIYLGRSEELWQKRDDIKLIDNEGKLVDETSY